MQKTQFPLSASITDFAPLFSNLEYLFKGLSATGVDGIELVVGVKSRWSAAKLNTLSEKYHLPIRSIHQPIWSGLEWYFDEGLSDFAKSLGTTTIVYHPLPSLSFQDKKMQRYLEKIAALQEKTGITVCLENMAQKHAIKFLNYLFPLHSSTTDMNELFAVAKHYNFKVTLDIDHLHSIAPHKEPWFEKNIDNIGNIHLSSFHNEQEHLPLYIGDFQGKEFMHALSEMDYKGLLTMEIHYPSIFSLLPYNFEVIKKSVDFLREK